MIPQLQLAEAVVVPQAMSRRRRRGWVRSRRETLVGVPEFDAQGQGRLDEKESCGGRHRAGSGRVRVRLGVEARLDSWGPTNSIMAAAIRGSSSGWLLTSGPGAVYFLGGWMKMAVADSGWMPMPTSRRLSSGRSWRPVLTTPTNLARPRIRDQGPTPGRWWSSPFRPGAASRR